MTRESTIIVYVPLQPTLDLKALCRSKLFDFLGRSCFENTWIPSFIGQTGCLWVLFSSFQSLIDFDTGNFLLCKHCEYRNLKCHKTPKVSPWWWAIPVIMLLPLILGANYNDPSKSLRFHRFSFVSRCETQQKNKGNIFWQPTTNIWWPW